MWYYEIIQSFHQELVLLSERGKVGRQNLHGHSHIGLYDDLQDLKLYDILQI